MLDSHDLWSNVNSSGPDWIPGRICEDKNEDCLVQKTAEDTEQRGKG